MEAPEYAYPEAAMVDSQKLLYIGKMLEKHQRLETTMAQCYEDPESLNEIVYAVCDEARIPPEREPEVLAQVSEALNGNEAVAKDYIGYYKLGTAISDICEALRYKKIMADNAQKDFSDGIRMMDEELAERKGEMKAVLVELSESSPLMCGIAVDSYMASMTRGFGLKEPGIPGRH